MKPRTMLFCLVSLTLLPVVAMGASAKVALAVIPELIPGQPVVEYLADKSLAYWFLALAAIAIGSWTWIFKWMIGQLSLQRAASADERKISAEMQKQLLDYMRTDHVASAAAIAQANALHMQLLTRLNAQIEATAKTP